METNQYNNTIPSVDAWNLDHHGLVAAICRDMQLVEIIDQEVVPNQDNRRKLSLGLRVAALIINALAITQRRLYLTPDFLATKPIEELFGVVGIKATDFNEHTLGRALDEIYEFGATEFFSAIALRVVQKYGLWNRFLHIDSTSFSVEGDYNSKNPEGDPGTIKITYGYSKDRRPDLQQFMMNLVLMGLHKIPIFCSPQDGNASDKTTFRQIPEQLRSLSTMIQEAPDMTYVADSAFYTEETLKQCQHIKWISRVPHSLSQAKECVQTQYAPQDWIQLDAKLSYHEMQITYADIKQRWILVFSKEAYQRDQKTFEKRYKKAETTLQKILAELDKKIYGCSKDLEHHIASIQNKHPWFTITHEISPVKGHNKPGRPKESIASEIIGYRVKTSYVQNKEAVERYLLQQGRFIIATNELDAQALSSKQIIEAYKQQNLVEQGFRFLKDPFFLSHYVFLKSPKRIQALCVIMCLSLLVYALGEHILRTQMEKENMKLPNQKKKLCSKITLRWAFEMMQGICLVHIFNPITQTLEPFITKLSPVKEQIIKIFGLTAMKIYRIPIRT